jgi:hypothetical protein
MKRNTAIASFPIGRFVSAADGSEVTTGTVVGTYSKDGTSGAIAGTPAYDATAKQWKVALLAAETDGVWLGLNFTLAGCLPIHYTISTDTKLVSDLNDSPYNGGAVSGVTGNIVGNLQGNVTGSVGSVTGAVTVGTNNDKTGYSLSSTGLDSIAANVPDGVATTFPARLMQLWQRFFGKATRSTTQIQTYRADGTTVATTQAITDDGAGNETQGAAS